VNREVLFSHKSDLWSTPQKLFDELDAEFHFTLDPCADESNHKCDKYFTEKDDGLKQDWTGEIVFVNSPYGRQLGKWVEKCYLESLKGATVVLLTPARPDTIYQHKFIFPHASYILYIKGRLHFNDSKDAAPFPSQITIYSKKLPYKTECALRKYGHLIVKEVIYGTIK